jgi:hypothetical protein
MEDDGHAISYHVLKRGTPVRSADGVVLGTVRRAHEAKREHIFDGIVLDTPNGKRFVDAPEVARIAERAVTLTFPAAEAEVHLAPVGSQLTGRVQHAKTVRRAKRLGKRARDAWDRR